MAVSAGTVVEVRTTGNDNNGGGFNAAGSSPGTDRSQQDAPHVTIDGSTISAVVGATTTQLVLTGYTVSAADNRNLVRITGGTATAGWYEITTLDVPGNYWVLDRSAGTAGQTATGRMGGALATPGAAGAIGPADVVVWIKAGTYSRTTSGTNVAGGGLFPGSNNAKVEGYQTTRGDLGTKPALGNGGLSNNGIGNLGMLRNLRLVGSGGGTAVFLAVASEHVEAYNWATGFNLGGDGYSARACLADTCGTAGFAAGSADAHTYQCDAINGGTGFSGTNLVTFRCVSYNNAIDSDARANYEFTGSGASSYGFSANVLATWNSVIAESAGYGWERSTADEVDSVYGCFGYANTSGNLRAGAYPHMRDVTAITDGSPFEDAAGNNYTPNATALRGALLRGTAKPDTWPDGIAANDTNVGALGTSGSGGAGGAAPHILHPLTAGYFGAGV